MHESQNVMGAESQNSLLYQTKSLQKDLGFFLQNCGNAQFGKLAARKDTRDRRKGAILARSRDSAADQRLDCYERGRGELETAALSTAGSRAAEGRGGGRLRSAMGTGRLARRSASPARYSRGAAPLAGTRRTSRGRLLIARSRQRRPEAD